MELKLQYAILGLFATGRYSFDKKTGVVTNCNIKRVLNPRKEGNTRAYRFSLGFNYTITIPVHKVLYLLHYGTVDPLGKHYFKDGDRNNLTIDNVGFETPGTTIAPDVKEKIIKLFSKGWWYKKISEELKVTKETVRAIILKEFGSVDPKHYQKNKKFYDAMANELKGLKKK